MRVAFRDLAVEEPDVDADRDGGERRHARASERGRRESRT
jgi:hypothetical protein